MRLSRVLTALSLFLVASPALAAAKAKPAQPAGRVLSPEARALLEVLRSISGKHILAGQHNYPNTRSRNTEFVKLDAGRTPAVYSQDFGFAAAGDKDSYLARPDIVEEAKRQHASGAIVTLCWHAVPPTADEPVVFRSESPAGSDGTSTDLASVQGRLTDAQWKDLLTPGTPLNERWTRQVDTIAGYLAQLKEARVPVLWRPYHEMNGDWFWWGGRVGEHSTAALYRQMFDRLVKHHGLDNLVWVWSVDRPGDHSRGFADLHPGDDYVDVVSLDVYGADFRQAYYDDLVALARGRPVVLGEVGTPPTREVLDRQPLWAMYVVWAGMYSGTPRRQLRELAADPRVLYLEDAAYRDAIAPLRRAEGRSTALADNLHLDKAGTRVDFTGRWLLDEERSESGGLGSPPPSTLRVYQSQGEIAVRRTIPSEYEDDKVTDETLALDGTPSRSEVERSPRVTTARWSEDGDALAFDSTVTLSWGGGTSTVTSSEEWRLLEGGRLLSVKQSTTSPWGSRTATLLFERR